MPRIAAPTIAEHRAQTYEALLVAVAELIVEHGFEAISMGDIARRAGISRTAIYNYAPDKAALLIAAADRGATELRSAIEAVAADEDRSVAERLDAIVRLLLITFTHSTEQLLTIRAIHGHLDRAQTERSIAPFRDEIGVRIAELVRLGAEDGSFAPIEDPDLIGTLIAGVFESALGRVIADPASADRVADAAARFLVGALGARHSDR